MSCLALLLGTGCIGSASKNKRDNRETDNIVQLAVRFQNDAEFRRSTLEHSLVNKANGYAQIRLKNYNQKKWNALKEANFLSRPVVHTDFGLATPDAPAESNGTWVSMKPAPFKITRANLLKRGEEMFTRYPAQLMPSLMQALESDTHLAKYGLWQTKKSVGGLVWMALPGGVYPAVTCSSCHASADAAGTYRPGRPNHRINIGKAKDDFFRMRTLYSTWGPGRVDVAGDKQDNPVVIADVRAVRYQTHIHRTANVKNSLAALATRIETGLILAHRQSVRPAPIDAFALAYYLWSLGDTLNPLPSAQQPGRKVFARHCANCHQGKGLSGRPVDAARMKSPVAVHPSSVRGTGKLNAVSLRGVSHRGRLLFGGDATDFKSLLDPGRKTGGHHFGQHLDDRQRQDLVIYLESL